MRHRLAFLRGSIAVSGARSTLLSHKSRLSSGKCQYLGQEGALCSAAQNPARTGASTTSPGATPLWAMSHALKTSPECGAQKYNLQRGSFKLGSSAGSPGTYPLGQSPGHLHALVATRRMNVSPFRPGHPSSLGVLVISRIATSHGSRNLRNPASRPSFN